MFPFCWVKWAALWNSQSEQSSTLLFMTLPNKAITDSFILGRNPRVVNGHVKPFLEIFCPYLSHIPSMKISENNLKYCINAFYGTFKKQFWIVHNLGLSCLCTYQFWLTHPQLLMCNLSVKRLGKQENRNWKLKYFLKLKLFTKKCTRNMCTKCNIM